MRNTEKLLKYKFFTKSQSDKNYGNYTELQGNST